MSDYLFLSDRHKNSSYTIGKYSYGNPKIIRRNSTDGYLTIGKFCSFAEDINILLGGDHHTDYVSTYPFNIRFSEWKNTKDIFHLKKGRDVTIGNDVWIGRGVTILSGSNIGDGSVIAAGAVVRGNIEPYSIYGGVPAKFIKYRFSENQISDLLKISWWNWPLAKIEKYSSDIMSPNIDEFIKKAGE